ncbi:hypothetical protein L2W58_04075 [Dethiosulfovibrio sp. F2B]|uniref:hypothetical protein n=1 Tax=Dethiosulfovibrio faecalis TaxID=2720018 RepID=UPI001F3303DD|nr:hypothetical protein [Dethiosulfovibrio faecalis]MCF4150971.1 hypothetical protein [Dethiosulfovibrio faecalis]
MKKRCFLLSMVLVLALSMSAFAATMDFPRFTIDVPQGWDASEDGTTVTFLASDKSAALTVTVEKNDGTAIKDLAYAYANQFKASEPEVEDDVYMFGFQNDSGVDCYAVLCGDDSEYILLVVIGDHPQLEGMIDSIEEK